MGAGGGRGGGREGEGSIYPYVDCPLPTNNLKDIQLISVYLRHMRRGSVRHLT